MSIVRTYAKQLCDHRLASYDLELHPYHSDRLQKLFDNSKKLALAKKISMTPQCMQKLAVAEAARLWNAKYAPLLEKHEVATPTPDGDDDMEDGFCKACGEELKAERKTEKFCEDCEEAAKVVAAQKAELAEREAKMFEGSADEEKKIAENERELLKRQHEALEDEATEL